MKELEIRKQQSIKGGGALAYMITSIIFAAGLRYIGLIRSFSFTRR